MSGIASLLLNWSLPSMDRGSPPGGFRFEPLRGGAAGSVSFLQVRLYLYIYIYIYDQRSASAPHPPELYRLVTHGLGARPFWLPRFTRVLPFFPPFVRRLALLVSRRAFPRSKGGKARLDDADGEARAQQRPHLDLDLDAHAVEHPQRAAPATTRRARRRSDRYIHLSIYLNVYIYMYMYAYLHRCMDIHVYMDKLIHIYIIHICMYIYICIYIATVQM